MLHGHLDVVPGRPEQFTPRIEGDRLYGRGAYDMKGGLAAMMCAVHDLAEEERVRVHFVCVSDEESEEIEARGSDYLVQQGYVGDFAITGEPTDMHIGIQAKGVLAMRIEVTGTAAHGSTPWVGDNAVLKAVDVFRQIEVLPFARESSDLFDRPSINLGRIVGGDALNKVPDLCVIDVDVRYLPGQDADEIRAAVDALPDATVVKTFHRHPAIVEREDPFVQALGEAISRVAPPTGERLGVGRDGASDAISFIEAGRARGGVRAGRRRPPRARGMGVDPVARGLSEDAGRVRQAAPGPPGPGRASAEDRLMFQDIPRPGLWKRLLLGGFLCIFAAAGATAVAAFHEVDKVVDALELGPGAEARRGQPGRDRPGQAADDHDPRLRPPARRTTWRARRAPARTRSCWCGSTPTRRPRRSCRCRAT